MAKQGSTMSGLMDTIAILVSMAFQFGVPVERLAEKFQSTRFEPSGHTTNPAIPLASSISDCVFTLAWPPLSRQSITHKFSNSGPQGHRPPRYRTASRGVKRVGRRQRTLS